MKRYGRELLGLLVLLALLIAPAIAQDLEKAKELNTQAFELYRQAKYAEAIVVAEEALKIREQGYGPDHLGTAQSLNMLAGILGGSGDNRRALPLYERALSIYSHRFGADSPDLATPLNNLARCLLALDEKEKAKAYLVRALENQEKALGASDPALASTLETLGGLSRSAGELEQAERYYLRAVDCLAGGPDSKREYTLSGLGLTYLDAGRLELALESFEEALRIHEQFGNKDLSWRAAHLYNLAKIHQEMGSASRALPYSERVVTLWTEIKEPTDPQLRQGLLLLGSLYSDLDKLEDSWNVYVRLMDIYRQVDGPKSAEVMGRMATILRRQGKLEEALTLASQAVDKAREAAGADSLELANALSSKALVCQVRGDYRSAMDLLESSHEIAVRKFGSEHQTTVSILAPQILLLQQMEDFKKALVIGSQVLESREATYGSDHPKLASTLASMAVCFQRLGNEEKALPFLKRAMAIRERHLGPKNESTVSLYVLLADFHSEADRFDEAEELYRKAIAVWKENGNETMVALGLTRLSGLLQKAGRLEESVALESEALSIQLERLGEDHPMSATSLRRLAYLSLEMGDSKKALSLGRRAEKGRLSTTANIFGFTSARQRFQYQNTIHPHCLFASLGSAPDIANSVLRYKGLVLDSQVEDIRDALTHRDPGVRKLATDLRELKAQIARLTLSSSLDSQALEVEEQLRRRLESLESELAKSRGEQGASRRALMTGSAQVRDALPAGTALVEYVRYHHHTAGRKDQESRYGAIVMRRESEPIWVPLPVAAGELETAIDAYRQLVRGHGESRLAELEMDPEDLAEGSLDPILRELCQALWMPVQERLDSNTKSVVICPDGPLNFISFSTLLTSDSKFLAEKYDLTYVSSGRDLLAAPSKSSEGQALFVGNPDFAKPPRGSKEKVAPTADGALAWRGVKFTQLPFAEAECRELSQLFSNEGEQVQVVLGNQATEEFVRSVASPATLHLATHGYFLSEQNFDSYNSSHAQGAMFRNGLALAGAQSTVQGYLDGEFVDPATDGLLTAAEVSAMDLQGTRLVTLSACDTGSGAAQTGEGVMGLRRGFVLAGARNLVFSLWPVADKETADFMRDFYQRTESVAAPLALSQVQKEWLVDLRARRSLEEAVRLAGPFVLTFQGKWE